MREKRSDDNSARRPSGRPGSGREPMGILAVDQALDLLQAISARLEPQSLMQLSRESGMEPSKLHRYLVSLCRSGIVAKTATGTYALGSGAISLGGLALASLDKLAAFEDGLQDLVARLGESAFLYVWTTSGPVLIRVRRPAYSPVTLPVGTIAPMIGSASGPVFATYLPDEVTRPVVERDALFAGIDPQTAARQISETIAPRVRRELVHVSDTTLLPNSGACAAPVFDAQGDLLFVIGCSIRHNRTSTAADEVVELVRDAGREMSERMGHRTV